MGHKTFTASNAAVSGEAITFDLEGQKFTCIRPFPVGSMILFARAAKQGPEEQLAAMDQLLRGWLVPEDRDRWDAVVFGLSNLEVLGDIAAYIVEEATGRPTSAPSS